MAQTTILAAGTTAATSTDITVPDGDTVVVGLFMAASAIALPEDFPLAMIVQDTPGSTDNPFFTLTPQTLLTSVSAPSGAGDCVFRVVRSPCPLAVGVYLNQA